MTKNITTKESSIKSSIVCSEDGKHTYSITKSFPDKEGNKALVIQLYPTLTASDIDTTDTTMLHLINHLDDLQLKEVTFVNLFSRVCKVRPSVKELAIDEENLAQIRNIMLQSDFSEYVTIVAWGSSMEKNQIANEMKRRFIKMYREIVPKGILWQLTADDIYLKNESAVHVLYMGIRHKNSHWKLEKYHVPSTLQQEAQAKTQKSKAKKPSTSSVLPNTKEIEAEYVSANRKNNATLEEYHIKSV